MRTGKAGRSTPKATAKRGGGIAAGDGEAEGRRLRVLLVGFSPVLRAGLLSMVATDERLAVSGVVADAPEALDWMGRAGAAGNQVEVVLIAGRAPKWNGIEATQRITGAFPDAAVLVLSEEAKDPQVIAAIHAGAGGFLLLAGMLPGVLLESIHRVVEGGIQMKTSVLRRAVDAFLSKSSERSAGSQARVTRMTAAARLTAREVEVLRLMAEGESNQSVAEGLGITLNTVKKHVRNIVDKLKARSRTHAAIQGAQAGMRAPVVVLIPPKAR